jgi:predicted Zn-dependent protease
MKKFFLTTGLLLVIIASFSFMALKLSAAQADSFFNRHLREGFAKHPLARSVFGLQFDGDAKYDYLGNRSHKVVIEVDSMEGLSFDFEVLERFRQKTSEITGKPAVIVVSDDLIPLALSSDDREISVIVKKHKDYKAAKRQAVVHLLLLNQYRQRPTLLGSTHNSESLVLFQSVLDEYALIKPSFKNIFAYTTLLHEFGHQLGLDHNDSAGCLMAEQAEEPVDWLGRTSDIADDFCGYELALIESIKNSFKNK